VSLAGGVAVHGLDGIPEVTPGADLAGLILTAADRSGVGLRDRDVLVVTHKIVSKAEGRMIDLRQVEPSRFAQEIAVGADKDPRQVEVVLRETKRMVRMLFGVVIAETRHGFVCANAGVDNSNVAGETVCLLPEDPDHSAASLREELRRRRAVDVAVVISDTFGRPWRSGLVNVAIGVAGMDPFADYRGQTDPYGNPLKVTRMAIADALASAAELVMGKVNARPVALIRGYAYGAPVPGSATGRDMVMPAERDMFR
jgi:coenzyme F420-0:L-glutamate ligase/coenzyme F420-1:gamma-L-glutamate ligase